MPEGAELGPENPLASTLNQGVMGSNPIGLTKSSENSRVRTSWLATPCQPESCQSCTARAPARPFSLCCVRAALEGKAGRSVSSTVPSALVVAWRPVRIGDRVSLRCLARELRFQLMLRGELDVAMPWSDLRLVPRCPSGHGKSSDQGGDKGKLGHWSHLASFGVFPAQA
jgi:hypothetical protein